MQNESRWAREWESRAENLPLNVPFKIYSDTDYFGCET